MRKELHKAMSQEMAEQLQHVVVEYSGNSLSRNLITQNS